MKTVCMWRDDVGRCARCPVKMQHTNFGFQKRLSISRGDSRIFWPGWLCWLLLAQTASWYELGVMEGQTNGLGLYNTLWYGTYMLFWCGKAWCLCIVTLKYVCCCATARDWLMTCVLWSVCCATSYLLWGFCYALGVSLRNWYVWYNNSLNEHLVIVHVSSSAKQNQGLTNPRKWPAVDSAVRYNAHPTCLSVTLHQLRLPELHLNSRRAVRPHPCPCLYPWLWPKKKASAVNAHFFLSLPFLLTPIFKLCGSTCLCCLIIDFVQKRKSLS